MTKGKDKGSQWEMDAVKILSSRIKNSEFKRIAGSGAFGTALGEPILTGDIRGTIQGFPLRLKIEAKCGYGGEKQFALKREWINKIRAEAKDNLSFPLVMGKFSGARKSDGTQHFVVLDIDDFIYLIEHIQKLNKEIEDKINESMERNN
jgi:hypothetical protein